MFDKPLKDYKKLKDALINVLLNINKTANTVEQNIYIHTPELNLHENRKTIFFIVDYLMNGGVESRLFKIKRFLENKYYNVVFVFTSAHKHNYNDGFNYELLNLNVIILNSNSNMFLLNLLKLVNLYKPSVIEFQFKTFISINYKFMKQYCDDKHIKLNCTIHGSFLNTERVIQLSEYFHNVIFVGNYIYRDYEDYEKFEYIKKHNSHRLIINGISCYDKIPKEIAAKTKEDVLMISRIDHDKIKSVICGVEYCKKNKLNVYFLGTVNEKLKSMLITEYKLTDNNFLGHHDTYEYIRRHHYNYLFVIGVDQVAMEIGGLGIPVLISTYEKELMFLKKNNYRNYSLNYGYLSKKFINDINKDGDYVKRLEENACRDLKKILKNELEEFDMHEIFVRERDISHILEKEYMKTLE